MTMMGRVGSSQAVPDGARKAALQVSTPSTTSPRRGYVNTSDVGPQDREAGPCILLVEDEALLGMQLEEDLVERGYVVLGPAYTLQQAVETSRRERFDFAILDVNLNGQMVFPLADELLSRGTPFMFLSGYGFQHLPERFHSLPRLAKPYDIAALIREISRLPLRQQDQR